MSASELLIEIHDLHHTYGDGAGSIDALRGIALDLRPGEFVAVVGANGSGKTTLARHLNALLLPNRGRVRVAGLDTRDRVAWPAIRSQVAMVFQRPEDQIVATTVEHDVAFGPENLGLSTSEIEERVRRALETVGMWDLRHRPPHFLSAGQQQRVALAGALAMGPRCLVLDEATAMLDPSGRRAVLALLQKLNTDRTQEMAVLMITHFMSEAALAERVIVLAGGRVVFDGPPRQLFADADRLASWGLDPPPLAALGAELARRWPGFPPAPLTLDELAAALLPRLRRDGRPSVFSQDSPPDEPDPPAIAVQDLCHTYLADTPLATPALDGISLEIRAGEVVALLGPTGSGKSTLLQLVAGLLEPSAGRVFVAGQAIDAPGADRRWLREQVGMLFQKSEEQLFETYVGDDVAFGPRRLGLDRKAVRERVRRAIETAGLAFEAYKDRFTQSLSGGEKRKAALAGVLALHPRVLLLDEPTAGLDPRSRQELLATLRRLNREAGITLVIATHAMEDVAVLAHRALVLQGGRLVARGRPRQLFSRPDRLAAYGLEVPAVAALMHRLRAGGVPVPPGVLTLDEALPVLSALLSLPVGDGEETCSTI